MGRAWRETTGARGVQRPVQRAAAALALILLVPLSGTWAGAGADAAAPYVAAREAGRLGSVHALALADAARPSLAPTPVEGVTVAILPWSGDVEARLDAIKAGTRGSMEGFMAAASAVRAALTAWERDLSAAGGPSLPQRATTDGTGSVRFGGVPAGDWLLVAWREETTRTERAAKLPKRDRGGFVVAPEVAGHTLVRYWRSRLSVVEGQTAEATLTDRGVWLSAVDTILKPGVSPPIGTGPRKHR